MFREPRRSVTKILADIPAYKIDALESRDISTKHHVSIP
jgi:hypothetical protein